jgi:hypothetical protein
VITQDDIDAFAADNEQALAQAAKYAQRKRRGIPVDRWATAWEAHLVAQGIEAQHQIIDMLIATIKALTDARTHPDG